MALSAQKEPKAYGSDGGIFSGIKLWFYNNFNSIY